MKVLIADKFEKVGIDGLKELGCSIISRPDLTAEALPGAVMEVDPHILIVRSTRVTAETLNAGTALTLVIRAGAGIDTIDVAAASSRGIFVSNCPGKNSIAVAELERRVRSGEMAIAFSLFPTTLDQLMAVSDTGHVMPPKSTWFEPKLRSGLFVHELS